jgi:hypothetical protein
MGDIVNLIARHKQRPAPTPPVATRDEPCTNFEIRFEGWPVRDALLLAKGFAEQGLPELAEQILTIVEGQKHG